jgi:hypothetical protein
VRLDLHDFSSAASRQRAFPASDSHSNFLLQHTHVRHVDKKSAYSRPDPSRGHASSTHSLPRCSPRPYITLPSTQIVNSFEIEKTRRKRVRLCVSRSTLEPLSDSSPKKEALLAMLQKGGDPAAGSPTATLLRLRPSHRARLRPLPPRRVGVRTSGAPNFHGVTGGVYKARERIHRGVADPRLLAIPTSCSRVTDCNPNLDQVFPIRSTSRSCFGLSWPL